MSHVSCLVDAFSVLLGVSSEELQKEIGHDGIEPVYCSVRDCPHLNPGCCLGFHIQELVDICWKRNYSITEITRDYGYSNGSKFHYRQEDQRFINYVKENNGILIGKRNQYNHAWAKAGDLIISDGNTQRITDFNINNFEMFFILKRFL